jgi:enterochelin esterase-like enzyme
MFCRVLLIGLLSVACTANTQAPGAPAATPAGNDVSTPHDSADRDAAPSSYTLHGRALDITVHGKSLEGNRLGDSPDRTITIYLPPSYDRAPERRYPVIYLLGGFKPLPELANLPGFSPEDAIFNPTDRAIAAGKLGEVILVDIEGWNRLGGSFWVNSTTTGNWEDFVTGDVIATVDSRFRTIAQRESRGLYGGSMGGFGAISIAMHRPELFGTVFAQSPCCLALVEELGPAPAWAALQQVTLEQADAAFQHGDPMPLEATALAAAFAPDSGHPAFYGDFPYRADGERIVPAEPAYSRWAAQLPAARLDREAAGLETLRGFRIQYGDHDELRHIVASVPALDSALTAHGVPHELHVDHGGHVQLDRFANDAIPFFARTLAGLRPTP